MNPRRKTRIVKTYHVALRVRVRVQFISTANELADAIEAALRPHPGVSSVAVQTVAASAMKEPVA